MNEGRLRWNPRGRERERIAWRLHKRSVLIYTHKTYNFTNSKAVTLNYNFWCSDERLFSENRRDYTVNQ